MKVNKDALLKQKFWLGEVGVVVLLFAGLAILLAVVPGKINKKREEVTSRWKSFKDKTDVKNSAWVDAIAIIAKEKKKEETLVWEKAERQQRSIQRWPKEFEKRFRPRTGNRALEIKLYPAGTKLDDLPKPPKDGQPGIFRGELTEVDKYVTPDWIIVHTTDEQAAADKDEDRDDEWPPRFYRTPYLEKKITLEGGLTAKNGGETPPAKGEEQAKGGEKGPPAKAGGENAATAIRFEELRDYEGCKVVIKYERGMYFGDVFTASEIEEYTNRTSYERDLPDVLKEAEPLNDFGDPIVLFENWLYKRNALPVDTASDPKSRQPLPIRWFRWVTEWKEEDAEGGQLGLVERSNEIWIAQEDLWIYRELFRLIKKANDQVANFVGKGTPEDRKEPELNVKRTFTNPNWQLELELLSDSQIRMTLKNLLNRRQRVDSHDLDSMFLVQVLPGDRTDPRRRKELCRIIPRIEIPALGPKGSKTRKETKDGKVVVDADTFTEVFTFKKGGARGIYGVEQILTWETAAVKRIDQIVIAASSTLGTTAGGGEPGGGREGKLPGPGGGGVGTTGVEATALGHRTANRMGLDPFKARPKVAAPPTPEPGSEEGGVPPGPGGGRGPGGENMFAPATYITPSGLVADRYVSVTPQARRVPVALALIVDQRHIMRVQAAFASSPLRFLTNQVRIQRYPQSVRPQMAFTGGGSEQPTEGSYTPYVPGSGGRGPVAVGGTAGERGPGGTGGGEAGGPGYGAGMEVFSGEEEGNMELVLYGEVTLYERFPERRPPLTLPGAETPPGGGTENENPKDQP